MLNRKLLLVPVVLFASVVALAQQPGEYSISPKGDTINKVGNDGLKSGKWVIHVEELRGEPGYEEEGEFKNGKKEGVWRQYNLTGDLIGVENYAFGGKSGVQQYFTYLGDLIREEMWRGYNPTVLFDTIPIYGATSDQVVDYKIVPAVQYSVKHGEWRYFEAGTGRLVKSEEYDHNRLVVPGAPKKEAVAVTGEQPKKKVEKTPAMLKWEKENKGKKKVIRDGNTGM